MTAWDNIDLDQIIWEQQDTVNTSWLTSSSAVQLMTYGELQVYGEEVFAGEYSVPNIDAESTPFITESIWIEQ